jgi:hypothetical protein
MAQIIALDLNLSLAHAAACFRAATARVGASLHHGIPTGKAAAFLFAPATGDRASSADIRVHGGLPNHEIGCDLADLGAVPHDGLMRRRGVLAAHAQAVASGSFADGMALEAGVNAVLKLARDVKKLCDSHSRFD